MKKLSLLALIVVLNFSCGKNLPKFSASLPEEIKQFSNVNFLLQDVSGKKWSVNQFKKKIILVQFFSVACKVCELETRHFNSTIWNDPQIDIIGVAVKNNSSQVSDWIQKHNPRYPILIDEKGIFYQKFQKKVVPILVYLTPERKFYSVQVGFKDNEKIQNTVSTILNQAPIEPENPKPWDQILTLRIKNFDCEGGCTGYTDYFKYHVDGLSKSTMEILGKEAQFIAYVDSKKVTEKILIAVWKEEFNYDAETWIDD